MFTYGEALLAKEKKQNAVREFLREQIMGKSLEHEFMLSKRGINVMTRLSERVVDILNALVILNVFRSRSEAVAAYVESSIVSNIELYENLMNMSKQVADMRDSAMDSILEALQERKRLISGR